MKMMNRFTCSYPLALVLLVHCLVTSARSARRERLNISTDHSALLALKAHITSDRHQYLSKNWSADATHVCDWIGVKCGSPLHQRVIVLNISNMGFTGTVPPQLGNLSFLVSLDIRSNYFQGNLPRELSRLQRLRFANLSFNNFIGDVPMWFGYLPRLQTLILACNSFSGFIPSSISNSSNLEALDLSSNFLEGTIPEQIGNLSILKKLYLSGNELVGHIPSSLSGCLELRLLNLLSNKFIGHIPGEIGKINKLEGLYLGTNNLTGIIPREIGNLRNLRFLQLKENQLTGLIPREISNLHNLNGLYLDKNRFSGNIPRPIGNLTMVKDLYIRNNSLRGRIPEEIGNLHQLEELHLTYNSLNGSIPIGIFNITTLRTIKLGFNFFTANLPLDIGSALPNLDAIILDANSLGGVIPESVTNSSKLTFLSLATNQFTGSISNSLGNLRHLKYVFLFQNNLTSDPTSSELGFITSLAKCKNLTYLALDENPLNGVLPASIGNLSSSFKKLYAGTCGIKGTIPREIGNLTNLIALSLLENHLTGVIPAEFNGLQSLQGLNLLQNQLRSNLEVLCNLPSVTYLVLFDNQFSGSIPECFGNLTSFRYLDLANNLLTSVIPRSFWNLKDMVQLNLSYNFLNGSLALEIANLEASAFIDLTANQFLGVIPRTIGDMQNLKEFFLGHNKLQGSIPGSLGKMLALESLDLSNNNLSGLIPKSLEKLKSLNFLNLYYNHLRGEIPSGGPFRLFTSESFMFNGGLCGDSKFHVPQCPKASIQVRRRKSVLLVALLPIGIASMVVVALAIVIKRYWKKGVVSGMDRVLASIERVSYYQLARATDGYNESNLLGTGSFGSVYKGILDDGRSIAVKVFNLQLERSLRSFDVECEVLRNIRHRNLVKVISCCSNNDFRALVLEYLRNGSLEKWLYSHNCFLDIIQRLDVMIDVANALQYLHHEYSTPVIHCDLKPSNNLLDEDLVAYVSDFGVTKMLAKEKTSTLTNTLATIGYIAPEYGFEGLVSTKCDVYSFGIMLMEVFTRRRPSDDMFVGNLSLKSWISDSMPYAIFQVVDANLLEPHDEHFTVKLECLSSIMEVALIMECFKLTEEDQTQISFKARREIKFLSYICSIKDDGK